MSNICIYLIKNKLNGNNYIGQTNNFERRIKEHIKGDKQVVDKAINKYGKENFKFEIIHENLTVKNVDDWEIYYINEVYGSYLNKGYNCHIGGNCKIGKLNTFYDKSHTISSKQKISKNHADVSKENHPLYEKGFNKEYRKKISNNHADVSEFNSSSSKITINLALKIVEDRKNNKNTYKEMSNKYKLHEDTVNKICIGEHWICKYLDINFIKKKDISTIDYNNEENRVKKDIVIKILQERYENKTVYRKLSNKYNISVDTVGKICRGTHSWIKEIKKKITQN